MARQEKTVRVYEVLADTDGDGTVIFRFRSLSEADRFASKRTTYGRQATAHADDVPIRLARRWGVA